LPAGDFACRRSKVYDASFLHGASISAKRKDVKRIFVFTSHPAMRNVYLSTTATAPPDRETTMTTYKAATFNGNVVTGTGATLAEAKADAQVKAAALGSCIRKRIA